jgi:hypothetical protein
MSKRGYGISTMKEARHLSMLAATLVFLVASMAFNNAGVASGRGMQDATLAAAVQLDILPIQQSMTTSCGEAALTMAYNRANPARLIDERAMIQYAEVRHLYTPRRFPYTSPAAMVILAQHFSRNVDTGNAGSGSEALALLERELKAGTPLIIDVTTTLGDPRSGAHFVLITGIAIDAQTAEVRIVYNNPQSGETESAKWLGRDGIWNAWENNRDPGGSGWWLAIAPSSHSSRQ